jgi:predicted  nucleic acid-binding Zn-ribbon protein
MAEDEVMKVDTRLARLEETVANGFFADHRHFDRLDGRMSRLEDRMSAIESKLDVVSEAIRADIKTILDVVTAGTEEMRRTTSSMQKEHQAERRLMKAILNDHAVRLSDVEQRTRDAAD